MSTSAEMDLYVRNMFRNLYFIKEESTTHFMWLNNQFHYLHALDSPSGVIGSFF